MRGEVVFQDHIFYSGERFFDGGRLGDDINAVLFTIHHLLQAGELSFNDLKAPEGTLFRQRFNMGEYTTEGYIMSRRWCG